MPEQREADGNGNPVAQPVYDTGIGTYMKRHEYQIQ